MGGGYKDYISSGPKNYWLTTQHDTLGMHTLQRFYSGATVGNATRYKAIGGLISSKSMIVGQLGNNIYVVTDKSNSNPPIQTYVDGQDVYTDYIEITENKDAILDYLPESWLLYAKNIDGYDLTSRMYCYNHDTLVADGIEQS